MTPAVEAIQAALATVSDPEIHRPITELGMVRDVVVSDNGSVRVEILLTVAGCPLRDKIIKDVTAAVMLVDGVTHVDVVLDVMSDDQRGALKEKLRGPTKEIVFARANSLTKVYAIASGKGGVGKSSVTANLAVAMAADGLKVGLLDADVYGHSIPRLLGIDGAHPTIVEKMIMPVPAFGVRVISTEMFKPERDQPVVWRGPMLHRALEQFLSDVFWGDLDILLIDLPPGTGDVAISLAQMLPGAEIIVVTTPQLAAAEVAERAGLMASMTHQQVRGVIENMSFLSCPCCGERIDVFGAGGGQKVADGLSRTLGTAVPLLGQVPLELALREGGDGGLPIVVGQPESASATALREIAVSLGRRQRGLSGMSLGLSPASR